MTWGFLEERGLRAIVVLLRMSESLPQESRHDAIVPSCFIKAIESYNFEGTSIVVI